MTSRRLCPDSGTGGLIGVLGSFVVCVFYDNLAEVLSPTLFVDRLVQGMDGRNIA